MDRGISRIRTTTGAHGVDRVAPMKEREREELSDFAEELEHREELEDEPEAPLPTHRPPPARRDDPPSLGYPTEEEGGGSIDLTA